MIDSFTMFQDFLQQLQALGVNVRLDESTNKKVVDIKFFSKQKELPISMYIDFSTSAWLYFKDYKEGSDEVSSAERWKIMIDSLFEVIESLSNRPFT